MSNHTLTLISLSSVGCQVPGWQVPKARLIREAAIEALWPTVADDVLAAQALELACNLHSEALWWSQHQREAKALIADAMARLLALRKRARKPLKDAP